MRWMTGGREWILRTATDHLKIFRFFLRERGKHLTSAIALGMDFKKITASMSGEDAAGIRRGGPILYWGGFHAGYDTEREALCL